MFCGAENKKKTQNSLPLKNPILIGDVGINEKTKYNKVSFGKKGV